MEATTLVLTEHQIKVGRLLLNSWNAEYALRTARVINDEAWLTHALEWTFPQAYYSGLFSARALLCAGGSNISSDELVTVTMDEMAEGGLYLLDCDVKNGYAELLPYRIGKPLSIPPSTDLLAFHADIVTKVEQVARAHERFLIEFIGIAAFRAIVEGIPDYLREEFLGERFNLISGQS